MRDLTYLRRSACALTLLLAGLTVFRADADEGKADIPAAEELRALEALGQELPGRILFDSNRSGTFGIYSIKTNGKDVRRIIDTPQDHEMYPELSPDGKRIAYAVTKEASKKTASTIWMAGVDGSNPVKLAEDGTFPTFSADGNTIYFERGRRKAMAINADGSAVREIFPAGTKRAEKWKVIKPRVSRDGRYLVFISNIPTKWSAWYMDLSTKTLKRMGAGCEPFPFATEAAVAWVTSSGLPQRVQGGAAIGKYLIHEGRREVLQDAAPPRGHEYFPNLAANDRFLLFASAREGEHNPFTSNYQIYAKNLQTGRLTRVTFDGATNRWPKYMRE